MLGGGSSGKRDLAAAVRNIVAQQLISQTMFRAPRIIKILRNVAFTLFAPGGEGQICPTPHIHVKKQWAEILIIFVNS